MHKRKVVNVDKLTQEIESNLHYLCDVDKEYRNQLLGIDTSEMKVIIHKIARHRAESYAYSNENRRI